MTRQWERQLPEPVVRTISYDEFESEFQPVMDESGESYRQYDRTREIPGYIALWHAGRVWTAVDGESGPVLLSGTHAVNRLYHVVTKVGTLTPIEVV